MFARNHALRPDDRITFDYRAFQNGSAITYPDSIANGHVLGGIYLFIMFIIYGVRISIAYIDIRRKHAILANNHSGVIFTDNKRATLEIRTLAYL